MKRLISIFLALTIIITSCFEVHAGTLDEQLVSSEVKDNMLDYIQDRNSNLLLTRNNYRYMVFVKEFNGNWIDQYLIQMTDLLIETGHEPDMMKYIEVLVNIIATYEMDNASDLAKQCKMDNLKSFKDYAMDATDMVVNAVGVISGNSSSSSALEEGISLAVSGLSCLIDNTDNWIEAISNLEVIVKNYSRYEAFFNLIEEQAEGNLKKAASMLQDSMESAMLIKLETYGEVSDANYKNYKEFFFDDVFFTALKQTSEYAKDDTFRFFVDAGDKFNTARTTLKASWDLGEQIGTLVGNITVGAEDLINRVLEMMAIYEISVILQDKIYNLEVEFLNKYESDVPQSVIDYYILYSQYLIGCRIRGEYCLHSVIADDAGLLSWANKKSATEAKKSYENIVNILLKIQSELLNINDRAFVEVSEFFESYTKLVDILKMEKTDYWQFADSESYVANGFYLEWINDYVDSFSMKNEASKYVKIHGISLGDNAEDIIKIMTDNNWEKESEQSFVFYKEYKNGWYTVSFEIDKNNNVSSWYLNNWTEGEDFMNFQDDNDKENTHIDNNDQDKSNDDNYSDYIKNLTSIVKHDYWVIFQEGYRDGRIEMSSFDAEEGFVVVWDTNLVCDKQIDDCTQYCFNEEKEKFEKIGKYGILTDYALDIIACNFNIYNTEGEIIFHRTTLD